MPNLLFVFFLLYGLFPRKGDAQSINSLRQKIEIIISSKNANVGISIKGPDGTDTLSFNGCLHLPMQSVFKFHIAVVMLSQIDKGIFTLDQKIEIPRKDALPDLYSPIRDKYPQGTSLSISEIIFYTVAASDNIGCDILLKLLGGPAIVEKYFLSHGFKDLSIKINEEVMQQNWDLQFQNWTTALAATDIVSSIYLNKQKFLSAGAHDFLWNIMKQTTTGPKRLKGELPTGTEVAHKTGWSGSKDGVIAAVNDIGVIFLPSGKYFFISVFVSNSKENVETSEKIIADIAKAAWDYFISKP